MQWRTASDAGVGGSSCRQKPYLSDPSPRVNVNVKKCDLVAIAAVSVNGKQSLLTCSILQSSTASPSSSGYLKLSTGAALPGNVTCEFSVKYFARASPFKASENKRYASKGLDALRGE